MSAFAIRPPVQLNDGYAVESSSDAAAVVRGYASTHCSLAASVLLRRLEAIESADEAQRLALEFRAWAAREGLLLSRPPKTAMAARPLRHR
jgi:hypothetical protein